MEPIILSTKWILPRGARCGKDLLDPETVDASIEVRSVDLISIPYQVPRRRKFPVDPLAVCAARFRGVPD